MHDHARRRTPATRTKVVDRNGRRVGHVRHVYFDLVTGRAEWLGVSIGRFRGTLRCVPAPATFSVGDAHVCVDYDAALIRQAPPTDRPVGLDDAAEQRLYAHYGFAPPSRRRFHTSPTLSTPRWPLPAGSAMVELASGGGAAPLRSRWLGRVAYGESTALQHALFDNDRGRARATSARRQHV